MIYPSSFVSFGWITHEKCSSKYDSKCHDDMIWNLWLEILESSRLATFCPPLSLGLSLLVSPRASSSWWLFIFSACSSFYCIRDPWTIIFFFFWLNEWVHTEARQSWQSWQRWQRKREREKEIDFCTSREKREKKKSLCHSFLYCTRSLTSDIFFFIHLHQ